jgi:hypothetical protein
VARPVYVEIIGDSRDLERAFDRSARSAQEFSRDLAVRTAGITAGVVALTQGLEGAASASAALFGENAELSRGLAAASKGFSSLARGDFEGFMEATRAATERTRQSVDEYLKTITSTSQQSNALALAARLEAQGFEEAGAQIRSYLNELRTTEQTQRKFNQTMIDGQSALVKFTGAVDDLNRARGAAAIAAVPPTVPEVAFLTPAQRTQIELIGQTGLQRIPELQQLLRDYNAELKTAIALGEDEYAIRSAIASTEAEIAAIREADRKARAAEAERLRREAERRQREAAERARRARELAKAREQARQFRLIGLGPTGEAPIPTIPNLQRQFAQLQARLARGETIPQKLLARFAGISKALRQKITPETREAINAFFGEVRDALNKGQQDLVPIAARAVNTNLILRGLGLSPDELRRLRYRLAGVTVGGKRLAGAAGAAGTQVVVSDVYMDGEKVGRSVRRSGQRSSIRSPTQKRGPNAGRSGV